MKREYNVWQLRLRAAKIPFIVIGIFYLLSLIFGLTSFSLYESIFMNSILGYVVFIAAFIVGAYVAFVDENIPKKRVVQGGLLAGVGVGLLAAITSIILLKNTALMGVSVDLLLEKAAALGTPISESIAETQIMLGAYLSILFSPLINGGLGALFAWIGTIVADRFESFYEAKQVSKKKK